MKSHLSAPGICQPGLGALLVLLSHLSLGSGCSVELNGFFTWVQNKISALRSQLLSCIRLQHRSVLEFGPYSLLRQSSSVPVKLWQELEHKPEGSPWYIRPCTAERKQALLPALRGWDSLFSVKNICSWIYKSVLQMQLPHPGECVSCLHWNHV